MFCLFYDNKTKSVKAINGSGKSPAALSVDVVQKDCPDGKGGIDTSKFQSSVHAVTVPGAARGYEDLYNKYASKQYTLAELLEPAAVLAEEGFPVAPLTSYHWTMGMPLITRWLDEKDKNNVPLSVDGQHGPKAGEIMYNPDMARVLREFGSKGATDGFYLGTPGQAIIQKIQKHGGVMTIDDLTNHTSTYPEPLSAEYRGVKLWEIGPNGQGVAALVALTGIQHLEAQGKCPKLSPETIGKSADVYHLMIEMMRLGFEDGRNQVCCPEHSQVDNQWFIDKERIGKRAAAKFDPNHAMAKGTPSPTSCTISFQVVDKEGNAISFVNSNYMGFGSGIVPKGCGFSLQNRGFGFTVNEPNHPNALASSKRPYHTIIPGKCRDEHHAKTSIC